MAASVDPVASTASPIEPPPPPKGRPEAEPPKPVVAAEVVEPSASYRLVIDEDKAANTFVYKTINRHTGEVIAQMPSEELLRFREAPDYVAGSVISTKA